jgi:hypothetical protein
LPHAVKNVNSGRGSRVSRSSFAGLTRAASIAALLASGCEPPPLAIPVAPDMDALVQSYEVPSAPFDPAEADELRIALGVFDALLERTAIASYVFDVLESVVNQTEETGSETEDEVEEDGGKLTLDADGYLRVTRICDGWVAPAVPDVEENGELDLTTTFTENGLNPVIWGSARRCRYLAGETRLELRQIAGRPYGLSVYWGQGVDIDSLADMPLLFALNLTGVLGEEELDLEIDFRTSTGQEIEYRIERGVGSFIASIAENGTITLRAENGTFECPDEMPCAEIAVEGTGD